MSQRSVPSNRRLTPKKFFPKIKNSNMDKKSSASDYQKLSLKATALTIGILAGLTSFFVTLMTKFSNNTGTITNILEGSYGWIGYSVSIPGAFLGLIYAFIDFAILGLIFAWLYNKLL